MKEAATPRLLPTEAQIASVCVEIHLELAAIWEEVECVEKSVLEPDPRVKVTGLYLIKHRLDLDRLAERCKNQCRKFYSIVENWFVRAGSSRGAGEIATLSKFAFEERLYGFKNRCKTSPFVIEMIKGVRGELEALNRNIIPDLISVVQGAVLRCTGPARGGTHGLVNLLS